MASYTFMEIYFLVICSVPLVLSRKYDVDAEALRLFGEGFRTVLRRFRRTPDYLKILQEKHEEMETSFNDVNMQTAQYIENKIIKRVREMLRARTQETSTPSETTPQALRAKKYDKRLGKKQGEDKKDSEEDPVKQLDGYQHLHNKLSVQDRNKFKDMAFDMAGQMINMIIKGMGPDYAPPRNTYAQNIDGTNTIKTTTDHEAGNHEEPSTVKGEDSDKTFKFKSN